MSILLVKKFFRQFDMFSSFATFRTKGEPETRNTCAGILSFLILLLFVYLFISQFTQAANWQNIQSIETQSYTFDETRNVSTFMVAVGLQGYRLQGETLQYIRVQMIQITKNGTKTLSNRNLKTEKCTRAHWSELNNTIEQNFISFDLQKKICLALDQQFQIQQPSNGIYKILKIQFNACRRLYFSNNSMRYNNCADENMTAYKNNLQIQALKYFTGSVVYLNTAFNPLNQKATTKFMQSLKLKFTVTQGTEAYVQFLTYQIETDRSLLPYPYIETESGFATQKSEHNNFEVVKYFQHASCVFSLSSTSVLISRNVGKFDEILSYSGGLFGIIISFLSFFMMSFNEYRYELMAAESAFNYNEDGKKIKQGDLTYFLYLKYQVFDWVKTLTFYQINWKDCKQIDETREEAVNQLDITLMFKKIQYFQKFIQHVMTDKEKIGLFLTQPPSIERVKIKRMILQYYDKVIKGRPAVTIEDLNLETGVFEYAEDELKMKSQQSSKTLIAQERQDILHFAIQKYNELRLQIQCDEDVVFDQDEQKIEEYLCETFFMMGENSRKKVQRKIPLKILKRLLRIKCVQAHSSLYSINLQI